MLDVLGVIIFGSLNSLCTSAGGVCSDNGHTKTCCTNFYNDLYTGSCLPCVGSYGINCTSSCPNGYFGQFCRYECRCSASEVCDLKIGCIVQYSDSDKGQSTRSVLFIVIAVCCFVILAFGIGFYRGRRELKRLNKICTASIDVKSQSPFITYTRHNDVENIKLEMSPLTQPKTTEQTDKQGCTNESTPCDRNQWKPWVMLPVQSGVMAQENGLLQPSALFKPKSRNQTKSRGTFKNQNQSRVHDKNSRRILNQNM